MSVTIKTAKIKYKNNNGRYVGVDAVSDMTTQEKLAQIRQEAENQILSIKDEADEQIENIENIAETAVSSIPSDYTTLSNDVRAMNTATQEDVGMALKAKTVTNGKVTEWEFGEAGEGNAIIDDTAGDGDTEVVWSAGKTSDEDNEIRDNLIKVQATQPTEETNKIWFKQETVTETQIPTYEDFLDLKSKIADEFDETKEYFVGDFVFHEGKLYRFGLHHDPGAWWYPHTREITIESRSKNIDSDIATAQVTAEAALENGILPMFLRAGFRIENNATIISSGTGSIAVFDAGQNQNVTVIITNSYEDKINRLGIGLANRYAIYSGDSVARKDKTGDGATTYEYELENGSWRGDRIEFNTGEYEYVYVYFSDVSLTGSAYEKYVKLIRDVIDPNDIKTSIADEFSQSTIYYEGDLVYYKGDLYEFNTSKNAGGWVSAYADKVQVKDYIDASARNAIIANEYSSSATYHKGDIVIYKGGLYEFNRDGAEGGGPWITQNRWRTTAITVADKIASLQSSVSTLTSDLAALEDATTTTLSAKVNKPSTEGTSGQALRTNGDGTTEWADIGLPTDAQTETAINAWLTAHPEATTTVQDGTITRAKLDSSLGSSVDSISQLSSALKLNASILCDLGFESGGIYEATGIEFPSDTSCRTGFIPVQPYEKIYIVTDLDLDSFPVYEFASNIETATNVNERLCVSYVPNGAWHVVTGNTYYIRIRINPYTVAETKGHIFVVKEGGSIKSFQEKTLQSEIDGYTYIDSPIISGYIDASGNLITPWRSRGTHYDYICLPYDCVVSFETGYFGWIVQYNSNYEITSRTIVSSGQSMKISSNVIFRVTVSTTGEPTISDFTVFKNKVKLIFSKNHRVAVEVPTVSDMKTTGYPVGTYIKTMGFNSIGDYGEGLYQIKASTESYTVNNASVFNDRNGNFIVRIFDKPYLYLESLNVENLPWDVVNEIVEGTGLNDVRANRLNMSHSIAISNYDFTFVRITSSSSYALILTGISGRKIVGKFINATGVDNAVGLFVTNNDNLVTNNYIQIQTINATGRCVVVNPRHGKGIAYNEYHFGTLRGVYYDDSTNGPSSGLHVSIRAQRDQNQNIIIGENGLPLYSYEGEDQYYVDLINVKNRNTTGVGIDMDIEIATENYTDGKIDFGTSVFGTITGITFHNLCIEGSDIGIRLRCGERNPYQSSRYDSGIKSIVINNMRTREEPALSFFDMVGFFRDIVINPTSKVNISKIGYRQSNGTTHMGWQYNPETDCYDYPIINSSEQALVIDAGTHNGFYAGGGSYSQFDGYGTKIVAFDNIVYLAEPTSNQALVVTDPTPYLSTDEPMVVEHDQDTDEYVLRKFYENHYPCSSRYVITDDLSGTENNPVTVVLDLREYHYGSSAKDIKVSVPAYCNCYVRIAKLGKKLLCSSNAERKNYAFTVYDRRFSSLVATWTVTEDNVVYSYPQ